MRPSLGSDGGFRESSEALFPGVRVKGEQLPLGAEAGGWVLGDERRCSVLRLGQGWLEVVGKCTMVAVMHLPQTSVW